jgi:hypothetical protein
MENLPAWDGPDPRAAATLPKICVRHAGELNDELNVPLGDRYYLRRAQNRDRLAGSVIAAQTRH